MPQSAYLFFMVTLIGLKDAFLPIYKTHSFLRYNDH